MKVSPGIKLCFCFLVVHAVQLQAQTNSASPYSAHGLGELQTKGFVPSSMMGDLKYAFMPNYSVNAANPATYTGIGLPTFEVGLASKFVHLSAQDISSSDVVSDDYNSTYLQNVVFGFPIAKRVGAVFGLSPYSASGYDLTSSHTHTDLGSVTYKYKGSGGINKIFIGTAVAILKDSLNHLSIGANAGYHFGTIKRERRVIPSTGYSALITTDGAASIWNFDFGVYYSRNISENVLVSAGASYTMSVEMQIEEKEFAATYIGSEGFEQFEDIIANDTGVGSAHIPEKFGFGISAKLFDRLFLGADFSFQNWSGHHYLGVNQNLADMNQFSFGMAYTHDKNAERGFLKKSTYRLGVRYGNSYLQVNGNHLSEYGISFGASFPVIAKLTKGAKTSLNIGMEIGERGSSTNGMLHEQFTTLNIGFAFTPGRFDRWFVKPKIN